MVSREDLLALLRKGIGVSDRNLFVLAQVMLDLRDTSDEFGAVLLKIHRRLKEIREVLEEIREVLKAR